MSHDGNAECCPESEYVSLAQPEGQPAPELPPLPVASKPPTLREYKSLMRAYFTVRHGTVKVCGHKLDVTREPRTHCESCWFAFFNSHGELVQTADQVLQELGAVALARFRGDTFVKQFRRFMATLAKFKAEQPATEETNGCNADGHPAVGSAGERNETVSA